MSRVAPGELEMVLRATEAMKKSSSEPECSSESEDLDGENTTENEEKFPLSQFRVLDDSVFMSMHYLGKIEKYVANLGEMISFFEKSIEKEIGPSPQLILFGMYVRRVHRLFIETFGTRDYSLAKVTGGVIQGTGDKEALSNSPSAAASGVHASASRTQSSCSQPFGFEHRIPDVQMDTTLRGQQTRNLTNLRGKFAEAYIRTKIPPSSCD